MLGGHKWWTTDIAVRRMVDDLAVGADDDGCGRKRESDKDEDEG